MYPQYQPNFYQGPNRGIPVNQHQQINPQDERFIGGLALPFLLGGVAGAAVAPAFYRPYGYGVPYAPYPYPMYRPFY